MNLSDIRAHLRDEAAEQERECARYEGELRHLLRRYLRMAALFGALSATVFFSIFPFGHGHSLHAYWGTIGNTLVLAFLALGAVFGFAVLRVWFYWSYLRDTRELNQKYSIKEALARLAIRQSRFKARLRR